MKKVILAITICALFSSCASYYNVINPELLKYENLQPNNSGVEFAYKYDVLNERGNKKYAKKESQKGIKIVAVKVTNNTTSSFVFGKDYKVYSGKSPVNLLDPAYLQKQFRQGVPVYLLYLLLTPAEFQAGESVTPVGYVAGPGLAVGNIVVASGANKKFQNELISDYMNRCEVKPGETIYGLIGIKDQGYNPLTLK